MADAPCTHGWEMKNVRDGFIILEKCYHCKASRSYFSAEDVPPKEEYKEGDHYWNYSGSAQSIQFDLHCLKCGTVLHYSDLLGLMLCTSCREDCDLGRISQICNSQQIWVYAALTFPSPDKPDTLDMERVRALADYFTGRIKTPGKKIIVLPGRFVESLDECLGEVIKDVGMLSLTPEEYQQRT